MTLPQVLISIAVLWVASTTGAALAGPTVKLDSGIFTGTSTGTTSQFLGIPFAQPPVGDLRLRLPQPNLPYNGTHSALAFGPACPQQNINLPLPPGLASQTIDMITNLGINTLFPDSEDCLTINIVTPSTASPGSNLPVVLWIYGGGFEKGTASFPLYDGNVIVDRSILLGTPIVYASINYRLNAFGFLGGKEVKAAGVGNLGLQDQRQAMRWIQKYIRAFGGDPTKVTIWGESAGSISVSLQMLANGGNNEGLFRAAFMQSGSPMPLLEISRKANRFTIPLFKKRDVQAPQILWNACGLSHLPLSKRQLIVPLGYLISRVKSLNLAWPPRSDGLFITDHPQLLVQNGVIANVPFVSGDCDDEGTLFSLSTLNVTTETQFQNYVQNTLLAGIGVTDAEIAQLASLYPSDLTQGSPYDTGDTDAISPQYKRLASFQGDLVFQAPRRFLLQNRSGKQPVFAFLSKRFKTLPILGAMHVTDLLNVYGGEELTNYLVRFVNTLNPNGFGNVLWPQYTPQSPQMLTFLDGIIPTVLTADTFRGPQMAFLNNLTLAHPL